MLRVVGLTCLSGFALCSVGLFFALLLGEGVLSNALLKWAGPGAAVFFIVPAVLMSLHLHATDELTEAQKQRWRKVSRWGGAAFLLAFSYLIRKDRRLSDTSH